MPRVRCPDCGAERVVMEGKVKNCLKCGRKLSSKDAIVTKGKKKRQKQKSEPAQNEPLISSEAGQSQ